MRMKGAPTLSRRDFTRFSAALVAGAVAPVPARARAAVPPNILFILADDLGYADLSCYGRPDYRTPHIDRLAAEGMRFTSAYSNSPVCSATRTALITGRYQYRLPIGLEEPLGARNIGLPPSHPTLPSLLRARGYRTELIGKWHLGPLPDYGPNRSGYDHFWGFRAGGVDYFAHAIGGRHDLWDDDTEIHRTGYLTDLLGDKAVERVGALAESERPFFLSLHFSAPHWPWEAPSDEAVSRDLAASADPLRLLHFDGGTQKSYAAMVERLDYQVGRVLAALARHRLARDTIVIFTSDNGGERFSYNWPFSGRKTELLVGGVRVPAIVRWPGRVARASLCDVPIMSMDWLPTLLGAAGTAADPACPPDGVDLASLLAGGGLDERPLYWRYNLHGQRSVRLGKWKYLRIAGNEFLFDIEADPMERANLAARQPDRFAQMKAAWEQWNERMLPYDAQSNTHGFTGAELPERFGVTTAAGP